MKVVTKGSLLAKTNSAIADFANLPSAQVSIKALDKKHFKDQPEELKIMKRVS